MSNQQINRIRIFEYEAPYTRGYGITKRILEAEWAKDGGREQFSLGNLKKPGIFDCLDSVAGRTAISELVQVAGIESVVVCNYEIIVHIAGVFDWADVEAEVLNIIMNNFFSGTHVDVQGLDKA